MVAQLIWVMPLSIVAAALVLWPLGLLLAERRIAARAALRRHQDSAVFLFDGKELVDSTLRASRLLRHGDQRLSDWERLMAMLAPRFPGIVDRLQALDSSGRLSFDSEQRDSHLTVEYWDGMVRLSIAEGPVADSPLDKLRLEAMQAELETLRAIADDAPQLIWKQDPTGQITWANRAYLDLAESARGQKGEQADWPSEPLFAKAAPAADGAEARRDRMSVVVAGKTRWFDLTTVHRGGESVHFAVDASAAMAAEESRSLFIQTLTKTFANLSTGLAIFDRDRRLVLFNPAFVDMTGLGPAFLSSRPEAAAVLDRLRENRMLPEPRNYPDWRRQMTELEAAAEKGRYCENWALPGGRTLRVIGRPHPDGALAFLFEDITDELSLTRRFRADQDLTRAVLDSVDEAIVVFLPSGHLMLTNAAYDALWGAPTNGLAEVRLTDELARWQRRAGATALWQLAASTPADGVQPGLMDMPDGSQLASRVQRLPGGALLVAFRSHSPAPPLAITAPQMPVPGGKRRKPADPSRA